MTLTAVDIHTKTIKVNCSWTSRLEKRWSAPHAQLHNVLSGTTFHFHVFQVCPPPHVVWKKRFMCFHCLVTRAGVAQCEVCVQECQSTAQAKRLDTSFLSTPDIIPRYFNLWTPVCLNAWLHFARKQWEVWLAGWLAVLAYTYTYRGFLTTRKEERGKKTRILAENPRQGYNNL